MLSRNNKLRYKKSNVQRLRCQPLLIVATEKQLAVLIGGNHNGAGRCNFDNPWHQTRKESRQPALDVNPADDLPGCTSPLIGLLC